jgi:peptidyl-prolyl cis-trans isomerase B (cyclophilin B)
VRVATNQMRREAAKRKLVRQQERRVAQLKRRQRIAVITSIGVVVLVLVGIVLVVTLPSGGDPAAAPADPSAAPSAAATPTPDAAPARALGDCAFTATPDEPASKPAPLPTATTASTQGTVAANLQTDRGPIPITLDRTTGPCAVENFISLAKAGYYDGTPCHRLTTGEGLKVLQCGDPTGLGTGGPGYTINDEPPTGLAAAPGQQGVSVYPRGTIAMAKTSAPDSGGSQFFLVYADSVLPPDYTVFGRIGDQGLATLDAIAAAGSDSSNGAGDGKPVTPVTIQTATVS